jgi:hypothetical protein
MPRPLVGLHSGGLGEDLFGDARSVAAEPPQRTLPTRLPPSRAIPHARRARRNRRGLSPPASRRPCRLLGHASPFCDTNPHSVRPSVPDTAGHVRARPHGPRRNTS